jgi:hypothetical protein
MNRQNVPCANLKLNGCQGLVTQRGNILCETCTETRKNNSQNKREFDFDSLMIKYRELESEIAKYKSEAEELKDCKNTLTERVNTLLLDKKNSEIITLNNSQLILDNEKLSLDNAQLKLSLENLSKQNELLSEQLSKKQPPLLERKNSISHTLPQTLPQTSRTRGITAFSKIPLPKGK